MLKKYPTIYIYECNQGQPRFEMFSKPAFIKVSLCFLIQSTRYVALVFVATSFRKGLHAEDYRNRAAQCSPFLFGELRNGSSPGFRCLYAADILPSGTCSRTSLKTITSKHWFSLSTSGKNHAHSVYPSVLIVCESIAIRFHACHNVTSFNSPI